MNARTRRAGSKNPRLLRSARDARARAPSASPDRIRVEGSSRRQARVGRGHRRRGRLAGTPVGTKKPRSLRSGDRRLHGNRSGNPCTGKSASFRGTLRLRGKTSRPNAPLDRRSTSSQRKENAMIDRRAFGAGLLAMRPGMLLPTLSPAGGPENCCGTTPAAAAACCAPCPPGCEPDPSCCTESCAPTQAAAASSAPTSNAAPAVPASASCPPGCCGTVKA